MFEHFRFLGASERSFSSIFRFLGASERSFSSIFRRQEASERAFSSIFDVWGLRSEHFRAFSTSGGFGASIFEVSRLARGRRRHEGPEAPYALIVSTYVRTSSWGSALGSPGVRESCSGSPAPEAEMSIFYGFRRPGHVKYSVLGLPGLKKTLLVKS